MPLQKVMITSDIIQNWERTWLFIFPKALNKAHLVIKAFEEKKFVIPRL